MHTIAVFRLTGELHWLISHRGRWWLIRSWLVEQNLWESSSIFTFLVTVTWPPRNTDFVSYHGNHSENSNLIMTSLGGSVNKQVPSRTSSKSCTMRSGGPKLFPNFTILNEFFSKCSFASSHRQPIVERADCLMRRSTREIFANSSSSERDKANALEWEIWNQAKLLAKNSQVISTF